MEPKRVKLVKLQANCLYAYADIEITRALPWVGRANRNSDLVTIEHGDIILATGRYEKAGNLHWCEIVHLKSKKLLWMVTGSRYHTSTFTSLVDAQ